MIWEGLNVMFSSIAKETVIDNWIVVSSPDTNFIGCRKASVLSFLDNTLWAKAKCEHSGLSM